MKVYCFKHKGMNPQTIDYIIKNYLHLDHEVCGNVDAFGNISDIVYGGLTDGRKSCKVNTYSKINFHTHPMHDKSYPSIEDILKVLKKQPIPLESELVVTKWGVWDIRSDNKFEFTPIHIEHTKRMYEKLSKELYGATERGRANTINIHSINTFITGIETHFGSLGVHVTFTRI